MTNLSNLNLRNITKESAVREGPTYKDNNHLSNKEEKMANTEKYPIIQYNDQNYTYLSNTTTRTMFLIKRL